MFSISKKPTISEVHALYLNQKATPTQVFQFFLNRAKSIDKVINAVDNFTVEIGEEEAKNCDLIYEEYRDNYEKLIQDFPLFGIPYSLKANILAEKGIFNASSRILKGFESPYSSTVYKRIKTAGGILLAISNMDEFAMGSSGENCAFAKTLNPYDNSRVTGGSSSGPIAIVSSGQVVFALGTDTGGSIRQPSSFCSTVGLKPTYGAVSRYGVIAMASSLDQVGPVTQTVEDNKTVFCVIAGEDTRDQTTIDCSEMIKTIQSNSTQHQRTTKSIKSTKNKLKIGIPKEFYEAGIDPLIKDGMLQLQSSLSEIGHELSQVSLPLIKNLIPVYYMIMAVEVASNLERYDGIRYKGDTSIDPKEMYYDYRGTLFGQEAQRRILLGTFASSAGYYDAYYNQAMKVKELVRKSVNDVLEEVDVLLAPITPEFAFPFGTKSDDPMTMYLSDIFTVLANPTRIPSLAIPIGLFSVPTTDADGNQSSVMLPTGCQIMGKELSEDVLFSLGEEIEKILST